MKDASIIMVFLAIFGSFFLWLWAMAFLSLSGKMVASLIWWTGYILVVRWVYARC